jgi:hypothetical protein
MGNSEKFSASHRLDPAVVGGREEEPFKRIQLRIRF